jgi:hypothetical protein
MGESNSVGDKFRQPCPAPEFVGLIRDDEHEDEGFMLIPSDQEAYATLLLGLATLSCTTKLRLSRGRRQRGSGGASPYPEPRTRSLALRRSRQNSIR